MKIFDSIDKIELNCSNGQASGRGERERTLKSHEFYMRFLMSRAPKKMLKKNRKMHAKMPEKVVKNARKNAR